MSRPPSIVFEDLSRIGSVSPTFGHNNRRELDAETTSFASRRPSRTVLDREDANNRFTKAVTLLLYVMSGLGMRPFSVCFRKTKTQECHHIKDHRFARYSIVGTAIWAIACLTQTFMTERMFWPFVMCTRNFSFFHMRAIIFAQQFVMHMFTTSLLFILMCKAAAFHKLFHKLNHIELPAKLYEEFRRKAMCITCGCIIKCVLVEFLFFWHGLKHVNKHPNATFTATIIIIFKTLDIFFLMAALTLPTGLFMLVCHFVATAFRHNRHKFTALADISVEHLRDCYQDYLQLTDVMVDVSNCFEDLIFVSMMFLIPVICTTALNFTRFGDFIVIVFTFFLVTISTFIVFMCHGIWLNEEARRVRHRLYPIFPLDQSIKGGIDHIMHKVNDWSWGIRIGKLMVMDRTTCIAILSAMITFVALWAQLSTNSGLCEKDQLWVWNETAIVNNTFDPCA